jgi:hypothetical protein
MAIENLTWLEEGTLTQRTDTIKRVAERIMSYPATVHLTVPEKISHYIANKLRHNRDDKGKGEEGFRRTASEVISSGFWYGCTDRAKAFRALAIELGTPTKYVETFSEEWLQNPNPRGRIVGHAFVDVLTNGEWGMYDPQSGFVRGNQYNLGGHVFREVGKGLDSSQVYMKVNGVYQRMPVDLRKLEPAIRIFKPDFFDKK